MPEYRIVLSLDNAAAASAAQAAIADLRRIEVAAVAASAAQQRASDAASAASVRGSRTAAQASTAASTTTANAARAASSAVVTSQDRATAAVKRTSEAGRMAATALKAMAGISMAALIAGAEKVRREVEMASKYALDAAKNLREDATLGGQKYSGPTAVRENLALRMKTGLDESSAPNFNRQFEGSLPVGLQKGNIDRGTADELKIQLGIAAARQGGDAGTHGDLGGVLAQFRKYDPGKKGVEQALGDREAIRVGLTEGRGDDSPLTDQLLKAAGSLSREGGAVPSLPELSALIGVTSLSGGAESAGTRAMQLVRGVKGGLTKFGKPKGSISSQHDYLTGLGVGENDTLEQSLSKIAPDLDQAKDQGHDLDVYLGQRGFRSQEERQALIEAHGNHDVLMQRFEKARQANGLGASVLAANEEFLAAPEGRSEVNRAVEDSAIYERGLPHRAFAAERIGVEAQQRREGYEESSMTYIGDVFGGLLKGQITSPAAAGRNQRLDKGTYDSMRERAVAGGIPSQEISDKIEAYRWGSDPVLGRSYADQAKELGGLMQERGIDPMGDRSQAAIEKLTEAVQKSNDLQEKSIAARDVNPGNKAAEPVRAPQLLPPAPAMVGGIRP